MIEQLYLSVAFLYYVENIQSNQFSGKPGNVREFDSCQGKVGELTKSQGENLVRDNCLLLTSFLEQHQCLLTEYQHNISDDAFLAHHIALLNCYGHLYFNTVLLARMTHDTGNHNMFKSATKCWGIVREFHSAGEWSACAYNETVVFCE